MVASIIKTQKEKQSQQRTHHPLRHVKSRGALITVPLLHGAGLGKICPEAKGRAGWETPGLSECSKADSDLGIQSSQWPGRLHPCSQTPPIQIKTISQLRDTSLTGQLQSLLLLLQNQSHYQTAQPGAERPMERSVPPRPLCPHLPSADFCSNRQASFSAGA